MCPDLEAVLLVSITTRLGFHADQNAHLQLHERYDQHPLRSNPILRNARVVPPSAVGYSHTDMETIHVSPRTGQHASTIAETVNVPSSEEDIPIPVLPESEENSRSYAVHDESAVSSTSAPNADATDGTEFDGQETAVLAPKNSPSCPRDDKTNSCPEGPTNDAAPAHSVLVLESSLSDHHSEQGASTNPDPISIADRINLSPQHLCRTPKLQQCQNITDLTPMDWMKRIYRWHSKLGVTVDMGLLNYYGSQISIGGPRTPAASTSAITLPPSSFSRARSPFPSPTSSKTSSIQPTKRISLEWNISPLRLPQPDLAIDSNDFRRSTSSPRKVISSHRLQVHPPPRHPHHFIPQAYQHQTPHDDRTNDTLPDFVIRAGEVARARRIRSTRARVDRISATQQSPSDAPVTAPTTRITNHSPKRASLGVSRNKTIQPSPAHLPAVSTRALFNNTEISDQSRHHHHQLDAGTSTERERSKSKSPTMQSPGLSSEYLMPDFILREGITFFKAPSRLCSKDAAARLGGPTVGGEVVD